MAKNLTVLVDDETVQKMNLFNEVNWSAVCRQAINNYINNRLKAKNDSLTVLLINNKIVNFFNDNNEAIEFLRSVGVSNVSNEFIKKRKEQIILKGNDETVGEYKIVEVKL